MRRGDIYWADLRPRSGSEQRGQRPCIVVSHNAFNQTPNWQSIIVVPVSTSKRQALRGPTAIPLSKGTGNLSQASIALCHQVTTLDRAKLTQYVGTLKIEHLREINKGLKAALDLFP